MSSWQSFFNQLTRPQKSGTSISSELICKCEKGTLIAENLSDFKSTGSCMLGSFCSIIQIDRFRALTSNSREVSIISKEMYPDEDFCKQKTDSLDGIL